MHETQVIDSGQEGERPPRQRRLLETGAGTLTDAFGAQEWGLLTAIAIIWGASFLFIEIGLSTLQPGVIAMARVGLGAIALAMVPRARRPVDREDLPRVAFLGLIWMGVPLILFPVAQQWIASSVAGMINAGVPLMSAAWSVLLLRRLPGRSQAIGLVIGFAGIVAISWPGLQGSQASALGIGLVVLAVILYGLATNVAVPLQQRYGALPVLLRALLAAFVFVAPFGLYGLSRSSWALGSALAMLPLGILGTGVAYVFATTLVGRVGGPRGSIPIYFVPVVAIVLGVLFLGEEVGWLALFGTALVLIGALLTSRKEA